MVTKKRARKPKKRRNVTMAENRYVGSYPVIGIRPTIDGRKGVLDVRGSLEEQTMNMAKNAAKLFEENLRYSNGEPVKVVIADSTIGRVGESAACADKFRKEGVDITLTVTPCWCYGSETMDMDPTTIKAVTERPGAVYLASVLATHAQKGLPAFGIYGHDVQEADDMTIPEDVKEKLLRFGRAAVCSSINERKIMAADRLCYNGYRRIYHRSGFHRVLSWNACRVCWTRLRSSVE